LWACWAFALFLLWRDTKRRPDVPLTVWLPTLWLMRCGSRSIDYWFGGGDTGGMDPIFIGLLMVCGFFVLIRRPCNWSGVFTHNSALFFFYGYLVVSTLWVDELQNPLVKIFRPLGDLVMALVVASEANPREAIITMFRRCSILLIPMSIVLIRYFPDLGRMQDKHWGADMWIGVTTHKNPLGQTCIIAALGFLWSLAEARQNGQRLLRQTIPLLYLAMTLYLFSGGGNPDSRSSTAIICLIVAVGLFWVFGRMRDRPEMVVKNIIRGAVVLAVVSVILEVFGSSLQAVVTEALGKKATLSDRTYLWHDVIRLGMAHPILGTGYGGFWVPSIFDKLSPMVDNHPLEAHNGYLETFANLGFVGVGLLAWVILQALNSATKTFSTDFEYGRLRLVLLFMVILMNYSEATFPRGNHLWWFGFLIVAVYARPWVAWPEKQRLNLEEEQEDEVAREEEAVPA
jgi:O-antigen ligase